ncbi:hypothetical protein H6G76_17150 [Nostoc sp. FACHB-152]|uniref:hypothetical protein n=1 Tax=unclassified Nostoc TaxID=2593658 RepID=UPI001684B776|nr:MULTISPECIES: hypothetical protein [unclassified Nostoc]MBD2448851.1 hypothetical protein [Nostoc sp. FACHB-152]MBD2469818.1 hypothetical protein [Nostoc sp. FACHB-145]
MFFTSAKTQLSFTLQWAIATVGGFLLSLWWIEIGEKSDVGIAQASFGGLAIAFPQSLILRHNILSGRWVLATLLAWATMTAIGLGAVGWIVPTTQNIALRLLWGTTLGTVGGFAIGIAQWTAIPKSVALSWQWILISAISWAIAVPIGSTIGIILLRLTRLFLGEVAGLAITWILVAILTGINAYRLLQDS